MKHYKHFDLENKEWESTLDYYNKNAKEFNEETLSVDFEEQQNILLKYLKAGDHILDLGCGSGRDSKAFIEKGYEVTAIDGSIELCRIASQNIGQEVICKSFKELNYENIFDSVWACASLIHVPYNELYDVMHNISKSLKAERYLYASFKHGDFEGEINGRYFKNFTKSSFEIFLKKFDELELVEAQITNDARVGRGNEKWLNVILRKNLK